MLGKMRNKIRFRVKIDSAWRGDIEARNVLPNKFVNAIGPFVFMEHIVSSRQSLHKSGVAGRRSHPLRGVATWTYILAGEVEFLDSLGNHAELSNGGAHWMNAGNGVIRDESPRLESLLTNSDLSIVEFWINLPSKFKSEAPNYFCLPPNEIPKQVLNDNNGWVKILSGEYNNTMAKVPCYAKEFLYHIHLQGGRQFSMATDKRLEYAAFLPTRSAVANDIEFQGGELIAFAAFGDLIEIKNNRETAIDIILFGGEPSIEPIVADETFVMNTAHEITQAYNDYYDGKYGQINTQ